MFMVNLNYTISKIALGWIMLYTSAYVGVTLLPHFRPDTPTPYAIFQPRPPHSRYDYTLRLQNNPADRTWWRWLSPEG
jgi:hypothetical protein